jgi:hypothetical protein
MKYDYPQYNIMDNGFIIYRGEDIQIGQYILNKVIIDKLGGVEIPFGIYNYNLILYLLEQGYITKMDIHGQRLASHSINRKHISEHIQSLKDIFPYEFIEPKEVEEDGEVTLIHQQNEKERRTNSEIFKKMANLFIGSLGTNYSTTCKSMQTLDTDTLHASYNEYVKNKEVKWQAVTLGDVHFCTISQKKRMRESHDPINSQIISQGIVNLLELIKEAYGGGSRVVSYNTDSVSIENPKNVDKILSNPNYRHELWKPKIYFEVSYEMQVKQEELKRKMLSLLKPAKCINKVQMLTDIKWNNLNEDNLNKDDSFLCYGQGGSGKTVLLCKLYDASNTIVFCPTNKSANVIREGLGNIEVKNVSTFDSYFYEGSQMVGKRIKRILVDEISMVKVEWFKVLYNIRLSRPDIIINLFGDDMQCKRIDDKYYDIKTKLSTYAICNGNFLEKKYIEEAARHDKEYHEELEYLRTTAKIPINWLNQRSDPRLTTNICYYNYKKHEINKKFTKGIFSLGLEVTPTETRKKNDIIKGHSYEIYDIDNTKKRIRVKRYEKATQITERELEYHRRERFDDNGDYIEYDDDDDFKREEEEKDNKLKISAWFNMEMFVPTYAGTAHGSQGQTIYADYNVYDTHVMNLNEFYVAASRGKTSSQLHIDQKQPTPLLYGGYLWKGEIVDFDYVDYSEIVFERAEEDNKIIACCQNMPTHYEVSMITNIDTNKTYIISSIKTNDMDGALKKFAKKVLDKDDITNEEFLKFKLTYKCELLMHTFCQEKKSIKLTVDILISEYQKKGYIIHGASLKAKKKIEIRDQIKLTCAAFDKQIKIHESEGLLRMTYPDENGKTVDVRRKWGTKKSIEKCKAELKKIKLEVLRKRTGIPNVEDYL